MTAGRPARILPLDCRRPAVPSAPLPDHSVRSYPIPGEPRSKSSGRRRALRQAPDAGRPPGDRNPNLRNRANQGSSGQWPQPGVSSSCPRMTNSSRRPKLPKFPKLLVASGNLVKIDRLGSLTEPIIAVDDFHDLPESLPRSMSADLPRFRSLSRPVRSKIEGAGVWRSWPFDACRWEDRIHPGPDPMPLRKNNGSIEDRSQVSSWQRNRFTKSEMIG